MNTSQPNPPHAVTEFFAPRTRGLQWHAVAGGFSGATVWRGDSAGVPRVALKLWPRGFDATRLHAIHTFLDRVAHLAFVPQLLANSVGLRVCAHEDRVWDATAWHVGTPRPQPSDAELQNACSAIAELHNAWAQNCEHAPGPGVRNRLRFLAEHASLLRENTLSLLSRALDPLLSRALRVCRERAPRVVRELATWENVAVPVQPCVRDLRGDHVLFDASCVTAIVDYGAMALDSPCVDLARYLGDVAWGNRERFLFAVSQYSAVRESCEVNAECIETLAHAGLVCSLLSWVVRLCVRGEAIFQEEMIVSRINDLLSRLNISA